LWTLVGPARLRPAETKSILVRLDPGKRQKTHKNVVESMLRVSKRIPLLRDDSVWRARGLVTSRVFVWFQNAFLVRFNHVVAPNVR
jgi:hypothetical protein